MEMKEAIEQLLEEKKNILFRERFRYNKGELGTLAIIQLLEKHGRKVNMICQKDGINASPDKVLNEIFNQSPLPNVLKTPKKKFIEGTLKRGAMNNIINKYSDYEVLFFTI